MTREQQWAAVRAAQDDEQTPIGVRTPCGTVDLSAVLEQAVTMAALHRDLATAIDALRFAASTCAGRPSVASIRQVAAVCRHALQELSR